MTRVRRHAGRGRARRGFTLLEAVVALAIVGTISVAVLAAFATELRTASRVRGALPAVTLAEDRLARLSTADAATLAMLPDSLARGTFDAPFADYAWGATAEPVDDAPGLVALAVTVTWPDGTYALHTRVYRPARMAVLP